MCLLSCVMFTCFMGQAVAGARSCDDGELHQPRAFPVAHIRQLLLAMALVTQLMLQWPAVMTAAPAGRTPTTGAAGEAQTAAVAALSAVGAATGMPAMAAAPAAASAATAPAVGAAGAALLLQKKGTMLPSLCCR